MCVGGVVNHMLQEPKRESNKFQLVRGREELIGEDGPGGPERGGDLPDATQLLQQSSKRLHRTGPSLGWKAMICDEGGH